MSLLVNNRYDKLYKQPILKAEDMPVGLEKLARKMLTQGLLRISAQERCNFIIHAVDGGVEHLTFSKRELYNKKLLRRTALLLTEYLEPEERQKPVEAVENKIHFMRQDLGKYMEVPLEQEIKIARILVQTVPAVIMANLINDGINFFVSYSHTISDLLDVKMWQRARSSQGLQSNDLEQANIFVSCGGNPFFDPKESSNEYDGFSAMAKLMIIASQEISHYADIIKDHKGRNVDRFSCRLDMKYPKKRCEDARQADLTQTDNIYNLLLKIGVQKLYDLENKIKIRKKYRRFSPTTFILALRRIMAEDNFRTRCKRNGLKALLKLKYDEGLANEIITCCSDMKFNLAPKADSYRNQNKNIEKAILCAEALARVTQQEVKWGEDAVKIFMPNLREYYYTDLMAEENDYYKMTQGKPFKLNKSKPKVSLKKRLRELNKKHNIS